MSSRRRGRSGPRAAAVLASVLLAAGCGGGSAEQEPVGVSPAERPARPLDLTVRQPDGSFLYVGELRGKPTLLFLFATFDSASQAALQPVDRFSRHNPDVHVVGVAVQPRARQLLDAWAHALEPRFPVGYDPEDRIAEGTSALGHIEAVPTFVMLDEAGIEVERHTGFASERRLDRMLWRVRHPDRAVERSETEE